MSATAAQTVATARRSARWASLAAKERVLQRGVQRALADPHADQRVVEPLAGDRATAQHPVDRDRGSLRRDVVDIYLLAFRDGADLADVQAQSLELARKRNALGMVGVVADAAIEAPQELERRDPAQREDRHAPRRVGRQDGTRIGEAALRVQPAYVVPPEKEAEHARAREAEARRAGGD